MLQHLNIRLGLRHSDLPTIPPSLTSNLTRPCLVQRGTRFPYVPLPSSIRHTLNEPGWKPPSLASASAAAFDTKGGLTRPVDACIMHPGGRRKRDLGRKFTQFCYEVLSQTEKLCHKLCAFLMYFVPSWRFSYLAGSGFRPPPIPQGGKGEGRGAAPTTQKGLPYGRPSLLSPFHEVL